MKSKVWFAFKITVIALILTGFCSVQFIFKFDSYIYWILLSLTAVFSLLTVVELIFAERNIHKFITQMDNDITVTERESLNNFPAPTIIIDEHGKIVWYNQAFSTEIYTSEDAFGVPLERIITVDFEKIYAKHGCIISYNSRNYRVVGSIALKAESRMSMIYFEDVTEFVRLQNEYVATRASVVLIMIDNYEDLLQNVKESEKANVLVQLEKLFENFMEKSTGIIRKTSNDRFIAVIEEKHLKDIIAERFKILDKARTITVNEIGRAHV